MSQLYKLFCEGLHSRSAEEGLSSTLIITSTPLDDDADDAGFVSEPPQVPKAPCSSSPEDENEILPEKESPNLSVQGQAGSAITESNNEASDSNYVLRPPSPTTKIPQLSQKTVVNAVERELSNNSSGHVQDKNMNVSPVDFVDRIIAAKNREKAAERRNRSVSSSSDSTESELPVCSSRPRKRTPMSDSSETDFEGANEFNQKLPSNLSLSPKPGNYAMKRLQENLDGTISTHNGSNINLVIDNTISSPADPSCSETQTSVEIEPAPSAARCRVFQKTGANANCSPERNAAKVISAGTLQNLSSQVLVPQSNHLLSTKESVNLTACMKGVVAYVEVRSGHDNRSMGVRTQLRALGATVVEKMSKEVTHVIFNEGSPTTLRLAKEQGCHLVSVLWIDECKKLRAVAPEDKHPPLNMHRYEQPENLKKYRKMKSLQPDFEEGKGEERLNKYIKKYRSKVRQALQSQSQSQGNKKTSSEGSDDEEHQPGDGTNKQLKTVVPNGIILKELSVVLNKINTVGASGMSVSAERRHKRRLMPLQKQDHLPESLENFDSEEHVRPENPYTCPSLRKQNTLPSTKRMMKRTTTSRRSSCFVHTTQGSMQSQCTQKKIKPQMRTMVCTFMHRREIDVVAAVIKQLGGWILEPTVSPKTTHVVCGDSKRTINLLRGIAHGCWILHQEWVMRSLEAGHWLDEEPFELNGFPAIQQCRVARETLGVSPDIFSSAGAIFVSKDTTPPRSDLVDLLTLCGGNVVNSARRARLIIGPYQRRSSFSSAVFVKEQWVLDSIQENMLQPLRRYHH